MVISAITQRGCFNPTDDSFKQQGKLGECVDATSGTGDLTKKATLCVCDDENKGEMLCNRSTVKIGSPKHVILFVTLVTGFSLST